MSAPAAPAPVQAPVAPAPVAPPAPSPRLPVAPAAGTQEAHLQNAKKFFAPDPSKAAAPAPVAAAEPAKPAAAAEPAVAAAPSIIKKDAPSAPVAAKPADAVAEVFPEDKLPEPTTEAARAGWKELKAMTKTERNRAAVAEARIKELEAKQTTAIPTAADTAELDRLRTEHKSLSDRLLIVDLQNHPDFHRQYVAPREKAITESQALLADNGVETKVDFGALLAKPRAEFAKTVSELAAKMNTFDAQTFTANMRQAFELQGKQAEVLKQPAELHKQMQQQTQAAQRQAFESHAKDTSTVFEKYPITPEMSADERKMADEYNQSVDTMRQRAEAVAFGKMTEKQVAALAFNSVHFEHMVRYGVPRLEKHIESQNRTISDLSAQLKALQGGKAPAPAGSAAPADASAPQQSESIEQAAKRVWGKR